MEDAGKRMRDMGIRHVVRYYKLITMPLTGWVNRKTQAAKNSVNGDQEY